MHEKKITYYIPIFLTPLWLPLIFSLLSIFSIIYYLESRLEDLWVHKLKLERIYVADSSYAAATTFKFKEEKANTIVMIGGSVTRESTLYDSQVEQIFFSKYHKSINFLNLGSSDQSLLESAAIAKSLNLRPGSIVFIQISFKKLDTSFEKMREEFLRPNMAMLDYTLLDSLFNYPDVFLRSLTPQLILNRNAIHKLKIEKKCSFVELLDVNSICYAEKNIVRHGYNEADRLSLIKKKAYVEDIRNVVVPNYLANRDICALALKKIAEYLRSREVTPVFIEFPVSDVEKPLDQKIRREMDYPKTISTIIDNEKYLDWTFDPDFFENDFYDSQHLLDSGKQKLTEKLLSYINDNAYL